MFYLASQNPYRFFTFIEKELEFDYVIRLKASTTVSYKETAKKVKEWLCTNGSVLNIIGKRYKKAKIIQDGYPVGQIIVTQEKKHERCLVLSQQL